MFYLSKLLGSPVRDAADKPAGVVHDLVVSSRQAHPRITAVAVRRRGKVVYAAWSLVTSFEESGTLLRCAFADLSERELRSDELHLSRTFLDKQLVDTEGRKLIRVNDIQLLRSGDHVHVAAVDVSSNAILRRVGLSKVGERLTKTRQNPKPHLIDWKHIDVEQSDDSSVRLAVARGHEVVNLDALSEPIDRRGRLAAKPRGEGTGPVARPVFKTVMPALTVGGGFDSLPSPPTFVLCSCRLGACPP